MRFIWLFSWRSFLSLTCATFRWIYHLSQMQQAMNSTSAGTHTDISSPERDSVEAAITDHQGQRDGPAKTPSAIMVQLAPSWYTIALSRCLLCVCPLSLSLTRFFSCPWWRSLWLPSYNHVSILPNLLNSDEKKVHFWCKLRYIFS